MKRTLIGVACAVAGAVFVAGLSGCSKPAPEYPRTTPDELIASAKAMVANNDAERLADLIHADDDYQRAVLNRVGSMLGHWQDLAFAVQERFPEDVQQLKDDAEAAAERGEASSMIGGMLTGRGGPGGRRGRGGDPGAQREMFEASIKRLFADPYGWLESAEEKLDYTYITDDTVAVTWEKRMILPPVGLVMQRSEAGQWEVLLPTRLPVVSRVMPQTPEEYAVWGSLVKVFDNLAVDLKTDIEEGRVATMEDLSRRAGERAFPVAVLVVYAYSRLMEERGGD